MSCLVLQIQDVEILHFARSKAFLQWHSFVVFVLLVYQFSHQSFQCILQCFVEQCTSRFVWWKQTVVEYISFRSASALLESSVCWVSLYPIQSRGIQNKCLIKMKSYLAILGLLWYTSTFLFPRTPFPCRAPAGLWQRAPHFHGIQNKTNASSVCCRTLLGLLVVHKNILSLTYSLFSTVKKWRTCWLIRLFLIFVPENSQAKPSSKSWICNEGKMLITFDSIPKKTGPRKIVLRRSSISFTLK